MEYEYAYIDLNGLFRGILFVYLYWSLRKKTYLCIRRRRLTTMWAGINRERRIIIKRNDVTENDDNRKIDWLKILVWEEVDRVPG